MFILTDHFRQYTRVFSGIVLHDHEHIDLLGYANVRGMSTKLVKTITKKLKEENALLRAKTSAIEAEKDRAGFYKDVIDALSSYRTETTEVPFDPYVY